jgi:pyruvate dehydrogenase E2 component (dihydrolipoamide acetyltransferase)
MPTELTMPQLSDTMTEGTVVKWLKKEGEAVKEGEIIAEVETDKATMEWEATDSGTLAVIVAKEGDKVKVGGTIAVLAPAGEDAKQVKQQYAAGGDATTSAPAAPVTQTASGSEAETAGHDPIAAGHAQSRRELTHSEPTTTSESLAASATATISAHGNHGNGRGTAGPQDRIRVSPIARRLAKERGIDLAQVQGTGPGGRIVQDDILGFADGAKTAAPKPGAAAARSAAIEASPPKAPPAPLPQRVASGQKEVIALNKMRATIALRLQQSKQQIPHFYETVDVEMEALSALREKINRQLEKQGVRLSISDFVNKAIAAALLEHPNVNAHFNGQKNEITRYGDVNLGIAVALPDGLIVPVLRHIDQMNLREIRQRSVDLADRARAGKLKQDELTGATFTVSTLGAYGVREFSAIINPPEVGILAVGAVEKRPVVRNDEVVARTMMSVTLSVDHRVVDGASAAEFLRTLKSMLEDPGMMLV